MAKIVAKLNMVKIMFVFLLVVASSLLLCGCGGKPSGSINDNQNDGSGGSASTIRTSALTDIELGYGGLTRENWTELSNNVFNGLTIKSVYASSGINEDLGETRGISVCFEGSNDEDYNSVVSMFYNSLSANLDAEGNSKSISELKTVHEVANSFIAKRIVGDKTYNVTIGRYLKYANCDNYVINVGDFVLSVFEDK